MKIKLITGIPRSGTTLCCKLLNERPDCLALHEPLKPGNIPKNVSTDEILSVINKRFEQIQSDVLTTCMVETGDARGVSVDNPVSLTKSANDDEGNVLRTKGGIRGKMEVPVEKRHAEYLFIKQNAMFAALIEPLKQQFDIACIVRNPVHVLLSWWTVDLPVNRGRIPGGESFDAQLSEALNDKSQSVFDRQIKIYQWFMDKFLESGLPVIKYEDILTSGGAALDQNYDLPAFSRQPLNRLTRQFPSDLLTQLESLLPRLQGLDFGGFYETNHFHDAIEDINKAV